MKRTIAVREIAYFLYSSGDLSADFFSNASSNDGKKAHQYLQRKYKSEDMKEYYIKHNLEYRGDEICIHGYIDGVLNIEGKIVLEEIKSTKRNLYDIDIDYHKEHLAQLMIYGYMYGDLFGLDKVDMQLTYIKVGDYKTKIIPLSYTINELKSFFYDSIDKYLDWLSIIEEKNSYKLDSIKNIKFPFENMRKGQLDFMKASYYTLSHKEILYTIAPTGIGKTMAALFSGLKALENNTDKLFYLTSKNMQKNICVDSIKLLNSKGLKIKSLVLTSKAKSCLNSSKVCDPDKCIYAKGFFNRLRDAFMDIYENYDLYTYDIILAVSKEHTICPFEFALYLSYFCDLVICDYNYVFDPRAHLIRYFEDSTYSPKLLIDEAHNLVSRGNDMYSSSLLFSDMDRMVNILSSYDKYLLNLVEDLFDEFNRLEPYFIEEEVYYSNIIPESFLVPIYKLKARVEEIFSDEENIENKDEALLLYFNLKDFADTLEFYGESHVFIVNKLNNNYKVEIMCLDAAEFIYKTINLKCHGAVLFSATLYPIKYYMDLLTMGNGRFMTLESPFDRNKLNLIINTKISTKYKDRENTIGDIIEIVDTLVNSKKGNHIVFFPSYKYMELFLNNIDISKYNLIIQTSDMNEIERINMFEMFKDTSQSHLGLFVLGGSFSEGIDFKDDLLSGVVVVGVGIPQVNLVNNLAKEYFDELYESGYDYAYTYPGLNKVIQAAGRVIRNETDRGSVILIDERYKYAMYQSLFPHHWSHRRIINNIDMLKNCLNDFYKENNDE